MTGDDTHLSVLPLPPHFQPEHAAQWDYAADPVALFESANAWRRGHAIVPASRDSADIHVLIIDAQKDFCLPQGSLFVGGRSGTGAIDDTARLARFLYHNLAAITNITVTMDTHLAYQIFFPSFWLDHAGRRCEAHRTVTSHDIEAGRLQPNPDVAWWVSGGDAAWLRRQVEHYCRELERAGKYELYLWPPHCMVGSDGHTLVGIIHEARLFHAYVRGAQSWTELKGDNPLSENYSVFRPEVLTRFDGSAMAAKNQRLLDRLLAADMIVIAGEASSHCVKTSVDDLLDEIRARDPALAKKIYVLVDCMSPVAVPDGSGGFAADFTPQADEALARFAQAGMHLVKSADPIEMWPDAAELFDRAKAR